MVRSRIIFGLLVVTLGRTAEGQDDNRRAVQKALDDASECLLRARQTIDPLEARREAGNALSALESVEGLEPDNEWMLYFRGLAQMRLGNYYPAMEAFDHALDSVESLPELDEDQRDLAKLIQASRKLAQREVLSLTLGAGIAYDSNVSFLGERTSGAFVTGRGDGRFDTGLRLAWSAVAVEHETLTFGLRAADAWHFSIEEFDFQEYIADLRYARRFGERWELDLDYDYAVDLLDRDTFLLNHRFTPGITYLWPSGEGQARIDRSSLYYQLENQDFRFETERVFDRDGWGHAVGFDQSFLLAVSPDRSIPKAVAHLGYRFGSMATEGTEFDRLTHDFYGQLVLPLLKPGASDNYLILDDRPLLLRLHAGWQIADYREPSLIDDDGEQRWDLITNLGLALSQTLLDDIDHGELVVHVFVNWTDADSNVVREEGSEPFTYDKTVAGIQFEWSF